MADEIEQCNVIRVVKDGSKWIALIGPDMHLGQAGAGTTPVAALWQLCDRLGRLGWPWDETWRPK